MTQGIYIFIKAFFDNITFPDGNGRLLNDRAVDQITDIRQRINVLTNLRQKTCFKIIQDCLDMRQHLQGIAKGDKIPGVCCFKTNLSKQTLKIIDWI